MSASGHLNVIATPPPPLCPPSPPPPPPPPRPPRRAPPRLPSQVGEARHVSHQVAVRREAQQVDAVAREQALETQASLPHQGLEAGLEASVVRVDVDLLSRLRVLQHQRADERDLLLARVPEPGGENLVAPGQAGQRRLPAFGEEVRDE